MNRIHNFSAGPAVLPLEVLQKARQELLDYQQSGRSVMEMSHRSGMYTEIDQQAKARLNRLLQLGDDFEVMFLQGGASSQFMMVPFNFLAKGQSADYIDTGRWSDKAIKEAKLFGTVNIPFSSADTNYDRVPTAQNLPINDQSVYVHFTSNNTVAGTQFASEPETNGTPLVCDASSDLLSRKIDTAKYGLIYAGAQKNVGPAGVTIVIIRKDFLENAKDTGIPTILNYKTHSGKLFNTPPTFNVYMVNLVLQWMEDKGGVDHFESLAQKKSALIYGEIDKNDFYEGAVQKESRSKMNITYRLPSVELEEKFLAEAENHQLVALKGHRSVGGIRASIYNACPVESVEALADFMRYFRQKNG